MDGTYGNPIGRTQSPAPGTPSTPTGQYQVNIGRTKTRKWVEAKVQSYDGDDWGDDDSDDEHQQEPVPPMPQPAAATSARLPSETRRQFSQSEVVKAAAAPARSDTERSEAGPSSYTQPRPIYDPNDSSDATRAQGYSLQDPGRAVPDNATSAQAQDASRAQSSSSPQLPNVVRNSVFGADMFAATSLREPEKEDTPLAQGTSQGLSAVDTRTSLPSSTSGTPEPVTEQTAQPAASGPAAARPGLPGGWVTETPSIPEDSASKNNQEDGPRNETIMPPAGHGEDGLKNVTGGFGAPEQSQNDPRALPVLQTAASPPPEQVPSAKGRQSGDATDIPPTQPLQPRKPEYSPTDIDLPPMHRQITQSTVTSSPVKESDVLRDEIMRSLSPQKEDFTVGKPPPPARQDTQESNYSLGGYENYWAGAMAPGQDANLVSSSPPPAAEPVQGLALNTQNEARDATPEPLSDSRQRFSWEMSKPSVGGPGEQGPPRVASPMSDKSDATAKDAQSAASPGLPSPPLQTMSAEPPSVDAALAAKEKTLLPDPPSPVSATSGDQHVAPAETSAPVEPPALVTSPSPPPPGLNVEPATPVTPTAPGQSQPHIMAFRDIMGLPTAGERIDKYNETRDAFASQDSGLDNWMTHLKVQHPEHADQGSSFYGAGAHAQGSGLSVATAGAPTGSQQQPYYQQYLNASSPAVNAPAANRSRFAPTAAAAAISQGATSTFGSSGNQIGTKGKEFMQSAGKMGKGLFAKGKNKLRGDKVFH